MSQTGFTLYHKAEVFYHSERIKDAFEYYQKSINKILKNEDVTAKIPVHVPVPSNMPQETLGVVWQSFTGFFRDPKMSFDQDTAPEAYKLLTSFRIGSTHTKSHDRFTSPRAKVLLQGMQIVASFTLGLLAWDKRDRATAAKRYREAIDAAKAYAPFNCMGDSYGESPQAGYENVKHLEFWVADNVKEAKDNLKALVENDAYNAEVAAMLAGAGVSVEAPVLGGLRKEEVPVGYTRIEGDGSTTVMHYATMATDRCNACGKRDVKLMRCGSCLKVAYCGSECQKRDWRTHKVACAPKKIS